MNKRERLPDASSRDTRRFLSWRTVRIAHFDSARDVIYPHLIWEFVHSQWKERKEKEGEEGGTSGSFVPIPTIRDDTGADFD